MPNTSKSSTKLGKLTKHDTLAHLFQFVDYVDDFLATPKHSSFDMTVLRQKCNQCKDILRQARHQC